jgi:hypothetical protein
MIAFVARIAIVVMSLGSQVGFAVADSPPKLNVGPSCNPEACLGDERVAQDQLTNNWSQYSGARKAQCVGMTTSGPSSYVELIFSLDIMKDAAGIYKADPVFGDFWEESKGDQMIGIPTVPRPEACATLRGSIRNVASRFAPLMLLK